MVEPIFRMDRFFCVLRGSSTPSGSRRCRRKTDLLLLFRLWAVLVKQLEQLSSCVLVESVRELCNRWRNFQTLRENNFLSLKADIFRPFHEPREVTLGLNILTNGKILGTGLEQRVLGNLGGLAGTKWRSCGLLSCSLLDGRLVIETGASVTSHNRDRRQHKAPRSSNARYIKYEPSECIMALMACREGAFSHVHDAVIQHQRA